MTPLTGPRLVLDPVSPAHLPRLLAIMREPSVASRWGAPESDAERTPFLLGQASSDEEELHVFTVLVEGEVAGWICACENLVPEYRHAGVDLFLATTAQDRGLGPEAVALVCRFLFDVQKHHRIVIDPAADNLRAIRAYEKVGFKKVGVLRRYERGADGTFHDGVMLDLLPEELILEGLS